MIKHSAKIIFTVLPFAVMMALSACAPSLQVTSDYDKSVDFKQYKTFAMVNFKEVSDKNAGLSELNVTRIINAIRAEMTKKGFIEQSNSDLLVNVVTILKPEKSVTANTNYDYGGMYRPYAWGAGMGSSYTTYNVSNYIDGSLIIDIVDAKTNKLIWEGIGNKEIDNPPNDLDTKIPAAVAKIMTSFPPGVVTEPKK